MIKINKLLLCLTILLSTHVQAKIHTFEEIFTGTIVKTAVIDPDNFDPDNAMSQSTLSNGDVTLTLFYPMFDFPPSHYPGAGTFTRADSMGSLSGDFNLSYSFDVTAPGSGFFDQDNRSPTLPNTGVYQYSWGFGEAYPAINEQGEVTLKINWTIHTPDVFVPVAEPEVALMLSCGLLLLAFVHPKGKFRMRFKYNLPQ